MTTGPRLSRLLSPPLWLPARWPAPAGIVAATSLRQAGDFGAGGRAVQAAHPERERLLAQLGVRQIGWLQQVHGTAVVQWPTATALPQADAALTTDSDMACAVLTADCLPVLLCTLDGAVLAAAHAGWRGLLAGVLEQTVLGMRAHSTQPVQAWLGPAIGPAAFEVGPEVREAFVAAQPQADAAFMPGQCDRWYADLYLLARQRLLGAGLQPEHLYGGGECTLTDSQRFHSWRRDGAGSGRMVSLIARLR